MTDLDYYDAVLVGIAASMLAGILIGLVTPVALETGVMVGTAVATIFVYAGVFRNPPTPTARTTARAGAIACHAFVLLILLTQYR